MTRSAPQSHTPGPHDPARQLFEQGTGHLQAGASQKAEQCFRRLVEQHRPGHAPSWTNLGIALVRQNRTEEAEAAFRQAIAHAPDFAGAYNNLGQLLHETGRIHEAIPTLEKALALQPGLASAHNNLGTALKDLNADREAEASYRQAIALAPDFAEAYNNLGHLLWHSARLDEAETCFLKALDLRPGFEPAYHNYALMLEFSSNLEDAKAVLDRAKAEIPHSPATALIGARLARRKAGRETGRTETSEKASADSLGDSLEDALALLQALDAPTMDVHFEMGRLYDRLNDTQNAFSHFSKANAMCAQSPAAAAIDKARFPSFIRTMAGALETASAVQPSGDPFSVAPDSPFFMVGFPRSGTTLLDQMLSGHPDITVAEEKPVIETISAQLETDGPAFPRNLFQMNDTQRQEKVRLFYDMHAEYAEYRGKENGCDSRVHRTPHPPAQHNRLFVDRNPFNMAHAPLIHALFPQARFIFVQRHPCDAVLSCFMQRFILNRATVHFLTLEDAAKLYAQLTDFWLRAAQRLNLRVHTLTYEKLVQNPKAEMEPLLEFMGAPWDSRLLKHDETARSRHSINTPSYAQVREKIYAHAARRWERYRPQLAPVLPQLAPFIDRMGYEDAGL